MDPSTTPTTTTTTDREYKRRKLNQQQDGYQKVNMTDVVVNEGLMKEYQARLAAKAKSIVFETFPAKILELQSLLDEFPTLTSPFNFSNPLNQTDLTILTLPSSTPTESTSTPNGRRFLNSTSTGSSTPVGQGQGVASGSGAGLSRGNGHMDIDPSTPTPIHSTRPSSSLQEDSQESTSSQEKTVIGASRDTALGGGAGSGGGHDWDDDEKSIRTGLRVNPVFEELGRRMTKEGDEVLGYCMDIRRWLVTLVPAIEEGNNTGVEIQELSLSHLNALQNLGSDCSAMTLNTYNNRASMVKAYLKSPGIEDRAYALRWSDRNEIFAGRQLVLLLQGKYLEVMHIFQKNWTKICEPKGQRERWD